MPIIKISMIVMTALPKTTNGLRARSDRLGGGGTCSGSSAARGLRGEMGGLSLIDATWILSVQSRLRELPATACSLRPYPGFITEYGETVDSS
jgi:hypothetical protein